MDPLNIKLAQELFVFKMTAYRHMYAVLPLDGTKSSRLVLLVNKLKNQHFMDLLFIINIRRIKNKKFLQSFSESKELSDSQLFC